MAQSKSCTGALNQTMSEDLQITGKGKRTHDGYLREIRKLADRRRKSPDVIMEAQTRRHFLHPKHIRHVAEGSLPVTPSAFRCFFRTTCPRDWTTLEQLIVKGRILSWIPTEIAAISRGSLRSSDPPDPSAANERPCRGRRLCDPFRVGPA